LFFENAADILDEQKDRLATEVNDRTYRELSGYERGGLPREESRSSILRLINFLISNLRKHEEAIPAEDEFLKALIHFEAGIASERVHYKIDLIDLLHGIRICRNKIWDCLRKDLCEKDVDGSDFFKLEKRINTLVVYFFIAVTQMYLTSRDELIASQSSSLKMWEEVVKSTSRLDLKIPCKEEFAAIVRAQAEAIARRLNYLEETVNDIVMAVGEACDNAIEHGVSEKGVDLHYTITRDDMKVEIIDYGKGFDPAGKGEEQPDLFNERGRGIFIMRNLIDSVELKSAHGVGTKVTITLKRVMK
jgi:serine/threonine-protein kinase RsbW